MSTQPQYAPGPNPMASLMFAVIIIVAMGVGFFGGYLVYGERGGTIPIAYQPHVGTGPCPHDLSAADQPIIAGMMCPGEGFTTLRQNCHCQTAHTIKDDVKRMLADKMTPEQIRTKLIDFYGKKMLPGG